jgi:hypothetical protein
VLGKSGINVSMDGDYKKELMIPSAGIPTISSSSLSRGQLRCSPLPPVPSSQYGWLSHQPTCNYFLSQKDLYANPVWLWASFLSSLSLHFLITPGIT